MDTTQLGGTGRIVSRLGFGGAPAGLTNYLDPYAPSNRDQRESVIAAIQRAVDLGITYFDTAASYGAGESERIFGEALDGRSDGLFVATKVGHAVENPRQSVENSLKNLRLDSVDLVQIHGGSYTEDQADRIMAPGGLLQVLEKARSEGLIRHIGFTSEDQNSAVYRFIDSGRFDVMQICYNLVHQHAYEPTRPFGSIIHAAAANMGVVTMRTLTSGVFQKWIRAVRPNDDFDYSAALLQFVLSNPKVDVALVGMRTINEVGRNVAAADDVDRRVDIDQIHAKYV